MDECSVVDLGSFRYKYFEQIEVVGTSTLRISVEVVVYY
jgi:hypothetical protein